MAVTDVRSAERLGAAVSALQAVGLTEVGVRCGDATKARRVLEWSPSVAFPDLVRMMVASDRRLAERERILRDAGHEVPMATEAHR